MPFVKLNKILLVASLAIAMSSCQHLKVSADPEPLPEIPADIAECFNKVYDFPVDKTWTKAQTTEIIGSLRKSELDKTSCGRRLLTFYNDLKDGLSED